MMKKVLMACLLLLSLPLISQEEQKEEDEDDAPPWFGGTLLSFYPQNVAPGRLAVQPFLFVTQRDGIYGPDHEFVHDRNQNITTLLLNLETGITKNIDIALALSGVWARSEEGKTAHFGDVSAYLGIQLSKNDKCGWTPDARIVLGETFPTGAFENLHPFFMGADASGGGSYQTFGLFVLRKIFFTWPSHPYNFCLNLLYNVYTRSSLDGTNPFVPGLSGRVNPGNQFVANLGFEYLLNLNWVVGLDIHYDQQNISPFKPFGTDETLFIPSSERLSLAPCLEYNFNADFGVEGGAWFSVSGRNALSFTSAIFSVFYYF